MEVAEISERHDVSPVIEGERGWVYADAFRRNRGLIRVDEQERLRNTRIAIAGMGGVGGVHLMTLARLGIGKFTIADPDIFEIANINRQYGATVSSFGRNKAKVMAEMARDINPELDVRVFCESIDRSNVDDFLRGADVFVDGLDFFAVDARRLVFRRAAQRGIWAVTAGPIGCSVAWLVFDPEGMQFDTYFDLRDDMDALSQMIAFGIGLAPCATHRHYIDFAEVDIKRQRGPSTALACQLAGGVAAAETLKILLGRGPLRPVPCYGQFDAYTQKTKLGRLKFGNRDPRQRFKRAWLKRKLLGLAKR